MLTMRQIKFQNSYMDEQMKKTLRPLQGIICLSAISNIKDEFYKAWAEDDKHEGDIDCECLYE